jgi:hypothetical protein
MRASGYPPNSRLAPRRIGPAARSTGSTGTSRLRSGASLAGRCTKVVVWHRRCRRLHVGGCASQPCPTASRGRTSALRESARRNHDAVSDSAGQIQQHRADCSGFVSNLVGRHGIGDWSQSYCTPAIPSATDIQPGKGSYVTIWNAANPGDAGHVWLEIRVRYFESAGSTGGHQMDQNEVDKYLNRGRYQPFHLSGHVFWPSGVTSATRRHTSREMCRRSGADETTAIFLAPADLLVQRAPRHLLVRRALGVIEVLCNLVAAERPVHDPLEAVRQRDVEDA